MSRNMIAALQVSLDGFTQGEDTGEPEWVTSWADGLALLSDVDAFVQGAGMYPGYGMYWSAIEADPMKPAPFSSRLPSEREIDYARFAARTPHYVLSSKLEAVSWPPSAKIVRSIAEIGALKGQPGKNVYVVGGATLVTSLLEAGVLDELRLIVHPILLGKGKALFAGLENRRSLELSKSELGPSGRVISTYRVLPSERGSVTSDPRTA